MNDQQASQMVIDRLSYAKTGRQMYELRAIDNEQLYINYIDENTHPYLSNISLPWSYIIVESYLGKCIQMLAAQMPYVRIVEEDEYSHGKARKVERDANMVLYRQKWPILAYNAYKQAFKYPAAFIYEHPWGSVKGHEMPIFELMNFFHTWVNPSILSFDDEDAYAVWETFVPKKTFKKYEKSNKYKNLSKMVPYNKPIYEQNEMAIRSFKNLNDYPIDKYSELIQLLTYWDHENLILCTNEGQNVIRNSDAENDELVRGLGGHIPIKKITPIPVENEFYGMSILEEGKDLFAECNENRNQYNDAVNLMLNPQWIISRSSEVKRSMISSRPGAILFTEDVNGVKPMPMDWNLLAQSLARGGMIERDIMNYSNAFPQFRGGMTGGGKTATETIALQQSGELRSQTYNLLLAVMSVEDMVEDIVKFKKMFMTEDSQFFYWPDQQTMKATPEDYQGNFTFQTFAAFKQMLEVERKQYIEAMTLIFGGANGAFLPFVMPKADQWLERLIDYFEVRSPGQLMLSNQELQQAQMLQQVQQVMQMIGGMTGGQQGRTAMGEREMRQPEGTPNLPTAPIMGNVMA